MDSIIPPSMRRRRQVWRSVVDSSNCFCDGWRAGLHANRLPRFAALFARLFQFQAGLGETARAGFCGHGLQGAGRQAGNGFAREEEPPGGDGYARCGVEIACRGRGFAGLVKSSYDGYSGIERLFASMWKD